MSFGGNLNERRDHAVAPQRDLAMEKARPPMPGVPKAPRAKPKAHTKGALSRELSRGRDGGTSPSSVGELFGNSESRRPRDSSPFTYVRQGCLGKEAAQKDNQQFPMGPPRDSTEARTDFRRGGGQQQQPALRSGSCPPWSAPTVLEADSEQATAGEGSESRSRGHARKNMLNREQHSADQFLEWGPRAVPEGMGKASYGRRSVLGGAGQDDDRAESFSRVMSRNDVEPRSATDGQPSGGYGRRNILAPQRGVDGHEESFARVMGR